MDGIDKMVELSRVSEPTWFEPCSAVRCSAVPHGLENETNDGGVNGGEETAVDQARNPSP